MCGISGIISKSDSLDYSVIEQMTDIISYRGPDDFGYLSYNVVNRKSISYKYSKPDQTSQLLLGHRRLSIIDLSSAGHQPMSYNNNNLWITFNGEIYNYIEIRNDLRKKGYTFKSNTDTEVILAAYQEWGLQCFKLFNGMWAFTILDILQNKLICCRDRFGIKPFYYYKTDKYFAFSSEIKQLLTLPFVQKKINEGYFLDYLILGAYGSISEFTPFEGIQELRGGNYLVIDINNLANSFHKRWWSINRQKKIFLKNDFEYAEQYKELFIDSVKLRLRSDVPLGTALSGGLDSSGIVCVIDKILKESGISGLQKTFTAISDVSEFDEREYVHEVIKTTNVEPFYTLPNIQWLIKDIEKLVWHQEEPFVSTSIFAGWCVANLIKENNVIVTLDGQGADELLGGYFPFSSIFAEDIVNLRFKSLINNMKGFRKNNNISIGHGIKKSIGKIFENQLYKFKHPLIQRNKELLNPDFFKTGIEKSFLLNFFSPICTKNYFDKYSFYAITRNPLPGILRQVDRNTMAFSIEARVPFLDYRLVEYTFSLPTNQKIKKGITKYVYRNAMREIIPEKVKNRIQKLGFVTAENIWFHKEGKFFFNETLAGYNDNTIINKEKINNMFSDFISGKIAYTSLFWKVINLIYWKKIYLNK